MSETKSNNLSVTTSANDHENPQAPSDDPEQIHGPNSGMSLKDANHHALAERVEALNEVMKSILIFGSSYGRDIGEPTSVADPASIVPQTGKPSTSLNPFLPCSSQVSDQPDLNDTVGDPNQSPIIGAVKEQAPEKKIAIVIPQPQQSKNIGTSSNPFLPSGKSNVEKFKNDNPGAIPAGLELLLQQLSGIVLRKQPTTACETYSIWTEFLGSKLMKLCLEAGDQTPGKLELCSNKFNKGITSDNMKQGKNSNNPNLSKSKSPSSTKHLTTACVQSSYSVQSAKSQITCRQTDSKLALFSQSSASRFNFQAQSNIVKSTLSPQPGTLNSDIIYPPGGNDICGDQIGVKQSGNSGKEMIEVGTTSNMDNPTSTQKTEPMIFNSDIIYPGDPANICGDQNGKELSGNSGKEVVDVHRPPSNMDHLMSRLSALTEVLNNAVLSTKDYLHSGGLSSFNPQLSKQESQTQTEIKVKLTQSEITPQDEFKVFQEEYSFTEKSILSSQGDPFLVTSILMPTHQQQSIVGAGRLGFGLEPQPSIQGEPKYPLIAFNTLNPFLPLPADDKTDNEMNAALIAGLGRADEIVSKTILLVQNNEIPPNVGEMVQEQLNLLIQEVTFARDSLLRAMKMSNDLAELEKLKAHLNPVSRPTTGNEMSPTQENVPVLAPSNREILPVPNSDMPLIASQHHALAERVEALNEVMNSILIIGGNVGRIPSETNKVEGSISIVEPTTSVVPETKNTSTSLNPFLPNSSQATVQPQSNSTVRSASQDKTAGKSKIQTPKSKTVATTEHQHPQEHVHVGTTPSKRSLSTKK